MSTETSLSVDDAILDKAVAALGGGGVVVVPTQWSIGR